MSFDVCFVLETKPHVLNVYVNRRTHTHTHTFNLPQDIELCEALLFVFIIKLLFVHLRVCPSHVLVLPIIYYYALTTKFR